MFTLALLVALSIQAAGVPEVPVKNTEEPEVVYIDRCGRTSDFEVERLRKQGKIVIRGVLIGYRNQKGKKIPIYQQTC